MGVSEVEAEEGSHHQGLGSPPPGGWNISNTRIWKTTTRAWRRDIVTEKYLSVLFCNPLVERRGSRTEGQAKVAARILVYKVKV